jgi:hypothetical protein
MGIIDRLEVFKRDQNGQAPQLAGFDLSLALFIP